MDLLKRHYEKLLLLFMLGLFIGIMSYVMRVAHRARSITDDHLQIPEFEADHKKENANDSKFNVKWLVEGADGRFEWPESSQREIFAPDRKPVEGTYSDLVVVFPISTCPHCSKLIPRYYFSDRMCPICGKKLKTPPNRPKERRYIISENDLDGDGMPNAYEIAKGFNPKDPSDQLTDADGDGFSNLYEYENGTDPKNPADRPPLWYRLRYISMQSVDLPIRLMAVNTMDSKDKNIWNIQLNRHKLNRFGKKIIDRRTNLPREETVNQRLGDVIVIEDLEYKITEVEFKQIKSGDRTIEQSTIKVVQVVAPDDTGKKQAPDVLVMQVGKVVKSNDKRLVLEDVGVETNRTRYVLRPGGELSIGTRATRRETYRLAGVDEKAKTARLERVGVGIAVPGRDVNGKLIVVTRESEIPEDLQVKTAKERARDESQSASDRGPGRGPER